MPDFLAALALYYLCDVTAATHGLTQTQMSRCMQTYELVKNSFAPDDPDLGTRNVSAYTAFKAWEAQNHALVAQLRMQAHQHILQ